MAAVHAGNEESSNWILCNPESKSAAIWHCTVYHAQSGEVMDRGRYRWVEPPQRSGDQPVLVWWNGEDILLENGKLVRSDR